MNKEEMLKSILNIVRDVGDSHCFLKNDYSAINEVVSKDYFVDVINVKKYMNSIIGSVRVDYTLDDSVGLYDFLNQSLYLEDEVLVIHEGFLRELGNVVDEDFRSILVFVLTFKIFHSSYFCDLDVKSFLSQEIMHLSILVSVFYVMRRTFLLGNVFIDDFLGVFNIGYDDSFYDVGFSYSYLEGLLLDSGESIVNNEVGGSGYMEDLLSQSFSKNIGWSNILALIDRGVLRGNNSLRNDWVGTKNSFSYLKPDVVIPRKKRSYSHYDYDGSSKPVVILALDFSESMPKELLKNVDFLLSHTPDNIVKVVPVTWSENVSLYSGSHSIEPSGVTCIDSLYSFVENYKLENGVSHVYTVVITDGKCKFVNLSSYYQEKHRYMTVFNDWFWVGLDNDSCDLIRKNFKKYVQEDNVFVLDNVVC